MATTPNYYENVMEDERFKTVDTEIEQQESDLMNTYQGMIDSSDKYYNDQIQASKDWADKQSQIQQDNTDFAIEQIEQEKQQANKDYQKEQSGAYVDWRKQSNQYGTEAEKMASAGLAGTGFSESSQVSMYNTYQNRVATARETFNKAVLNYNNAIKDAQLQNNAALAEIAYNALQQQLELGLQGFQYKNQLILEQANKKIELENTKWNRYQDILQQINTENALAEEVRQYNETQAWQTEQAELDRQWQKTLAELEHSFNLERDKINNDFEAKQNELNRKHQIELKNLEDKHEKERLKIQHQNDLAKLKKQQEYQLAQITAEYNQKKSLAKYEADLAKQSIKVSTSSTSTAAQKAAANSTRSRVQNVNSFTGSTYKEAVAYLKAKGIDGSAAMTESEWRSRKARGSTAAEVKNNATYEEYIKDYVAYKMSGSK